jgi:hypothetical protein
LKIAAKPPPRSSLPVNPHRFPPAFPLLRNHWLLPLALVLYEMAVSTTPYNVTELCAYDCSAMTLVPLTINTDSRNLFICSSPKSLWIEIHLELISVPAAPDVMGLDSCECVRQAYSIAVDIFYKLEEMNSYQTEFTRLNSTATHASTRARNEIAHREDSTIANE